MKWKFRPAILLAIVNVELLVNDAKKWPAQTWCLDRAKDHDATEKGERSVKGKIASRQSGGPDWRRRLA